MFHAVMRFEKYLLATFLALAFAGSTTYFPSDRSAHHQTPLAATKERVAEIMRESLKQGQGSVGGVRTYTRTPTSPQAVEELRHLGRGAIYALTDYALGDNPQEQRLAIELLGRVGGRGVVDPLATVLRRSPSPSMRELALRWLPLDQGDAVRRVLARAAHTDPDARVRELALHRLANRSLR